MELPQTSMEPELNLTYTQLKLRLAEALGVVEVAPSTLSRWMRCLRIKTGGFYDLEELVALQGLGRAYQLRLTKQNAVDYAVSVVENFRDANQYRTVETPQSPPKPQG